VPKPELPPIHLELLDRREPETGAEAGARAVGQLRLRREIAPTAELPSDPALKLGFVHV
jgi:hypothetical protein